MKTSILLTALLLSFNVMADGLKGTADIQDEIGVRWDRTDTRLNLDVTDSVNPLTVYAEWNPNSKSCVIHARKPQSENDDAAFIALGHELTHCFLHDFHEGGGQLMQSKLDRTDKALTKAILNQ